MTTENLLVLGILAVTVVLFVSEKRQVDIDLSVMSTRGRSGLSRWLLGSVADRVVRGATVPLLLVQARVEKEIQ